MLLNNQKKSLGKACVIIKDITELKRAEESLKKNKEKYYDLFYNARVGIFRCRINKMELLDVNKKITELSGYTKEELLNDVSIVKFPYPEEIENIMRKLEEEGFIENHEVHILDKMGNIRTALVSFKLYPEEDFF
nr:PAS domain-containing protein [Methanobacterium formicicum]